LAILASIGIHAAFLVAAGGHPSGGIQPANRIDARLPQPPLSLLQVTAPEAESFDRGDTELESPVAIAPPVDVAAPTAAMPAPAAEAAPPAEEALIPLGEPSRYYLAHELDIRPQIMTRVDPEYPATALSRGMSVAFQTRIYIDETGKVERVVVPEGEESDLFAPAVVRAFLAARYSPGIRNGLPVKSLVLLEMKFETMELGDTFRSNRY
jgi:protein TonB